MEPKITIIIPFYNVENYIEKCINSVEAQTFTDFECILDIAVQYKEIKTKASEEIEFIPYVVEVGDIGKKKGWKEIDCTGKKFVCDKKYPKIDAPVEFQII